jgi:hypothetical protein
MTESEKPVAVIAHHHGGGVGLMHLMRAAALAAGCSIEFGGPGPQNLTDRGPRGRSGRTLIPLQLRAGAVDHIYTPKPLTKRQKRRLRGKGRA